MKIFVATPVYDGKIPVQTVISLLNEKDMALRCGDTIQTGFLPNCSHPAMGRNQLVQDFIDSDADRLVFIDSDVTWTMGSVVKLAHSKVDFIGGAYRYKLEREDYPVGWLDSSAETEINGLKGLWMDPEFRAIEVRYLPGGFLSLSREVFARLKTAHPERKYSHFGRDHHGYFTMPWKDGAIYGEDANFCDEWRAAGGKVYLDPEIALTHWDHNKPYPGHIGQWLKRQSGIMPQGAA